jgi:hypothetical protein
MAEYVKCNECKKFVMYKMMCDIDGTINYEPSIPIVCMAYTRKPKIEDFLDDEECIYD